MQTNIADTEGQSASVTSDVNVSLPAFSVSGESPTVTEGQSQNNVEVGTLTDTAGSYSIASDYTATYTIPLSGGMNGPFNEPLSVTLVPDSSTPGTYALTVDLPALPADAPTGALYVSAAAPGASTGITTGVTVGVTACNTLETLANYSGAPTIAFRQPGAVQIAQYYDNIALSGEADPTTYTGTATLNGQNYTVAFSDGAVIIPDGSILAPGTSGVDGAGGGWSSIRRQWIKFRQIAAGWKERLDGACPRQARGRGAVRAAGGRLADPL